MENLISSLVSRYERGMLTRIIREGADFVGCGEISVRSRSRTTATHAAEVHARARGGEHRVGATNATTLRLGNA